MTINFQREFVEAIKNGSKNQTIRKVGKRKFFVGQALQLYTGQRTSKCEKISDSIVTQLQTFSIGDYDNFTMPDVHVNDKLLSVQELVEFAESDGFSTWGSFIDFFDYKYGTPFSGRVIHWKPVPLATQEGET